MQVSDPIVVSIAGTVTLAVFAVLGWALRQVMADQRKLVIDIEVMKLKMIEALSLRNDVRNNRENIIRLEHKTDGHKKDLDALHIAKRDIEQRISK